MNYRISNGYSAATQPRDNVSDAVIDAHQIKWRRGDRLEIQVQGPRGEWMNPSRREDMYEAWFYCPIEAGEKNPELIEKLAAVAVRHALNLQQMIDSVVADVEGNIESTHIVGGKDDFCKND